LSNQGVLETRQKGQSTNSKAAQNNPFVGALRKKWGEGGIRVEGNLKKGAPREPRQLAGKKKNSYPRG